MTEESIFSAAIAIPDAAARAAFLDRACAGNVELRERLDALIAAHFSADPAIDRTASAADFARTREVDGTRSVPLPTEAVGVVIAGRYKLLQQIGEGGMGTVWMADQTEPVKRRVAVKLIRTERGNSKTILTRFEAERQAIALMDHPHIAKLLDAGTEGGAPFFVMELVKGVPLTDYCDQHTLSIPDRLALFQQICGAVQHAHQKGVIHRDLKPSNILVESHDGKPVPKVIDFGLAKATSGLQLTENTLFTGFGSVMGTPLYMAPEQATFNAVDIDTRADVYALGVILYELLTGTTPLTRESIKKAALDEMLRLIREQEAVTPSSRLSSSEAKPTVAANRQTEPAKLGRLVKGELDWIVLKALSKDRDRRYETANGFARDVERFLNHEPVQAGPPTAGYRLRKFVRRNRGPVLAGSLVLLALLLGIAGTTFGLLRAEERRKEADQAREREKERAEGEERAKIDAQRERGEAEHARAAAAAAEAQERLRADSERKAKEEAIRERDYARAIAAFVRDDFLALTSVEGQERFGGAALSKDTTLRELLDRAADKLRQRKDLAPRIEADLCWMVGVNYRGVGDYGRATEFLKRAYERRRQVLGPDHLDVLSAANSLAVTYGQAGRAEDSLPLLEETLRRAKETYGADHPEAQTTLGNLAVGYKVTGRLDRALPLYEESVRRSKATRGPDHPHTLTAMSNLAEGYKAAGDFTRAVPLWEDVLRLRREHLGPDHPHTLISLSNLASGHTAAGRPDLAVPLHEEVLRVRRRILDADHPDVLAAMNNLAVACWMSNRLDRSVPLFEQLLPIQEKKLTRQHPHTLTTVANLGVNYKDAGRPAEAIPLLEEVYRASKKMPQLGWVVPQLLDAYHRGGQTGRAVRLVAAAVADDRAALPKDGPQLASGLAYYGSLLLEYRSFADAEPLLRECLAIREKTQPDAWTTFNTQSMLGGVLLGQKKHADAEPLLVKGYEGMKKREKSIPPQGSTRIPEALDRLIELYTATDKPDEARKWRAERAKFRETLPPPRKE